MTSGPISDRIAWGVELLAPHANDRILEIGCGHGIAVSLFCARMSGGTVLGIDRSPTMVAMARRRNAGLVAAGRVEIRQATFPAGAIEISNGPFTKLLAINVPLFRDEPAETDRAIRRLLTADGLLVLVSHPPHDSSVEPWVASTTARLTELGFTSVESQIGDQQPVRVAGIVARV